MEIDKEKQSPSARAQKDAIDAVGKIVFCARNFRFEFTGKMVVMGVLNVTPDSFFDGGKYFSLDSAVDRAYELAEQGAGIIDIGGESTRPGAKPVSEEEELRRVIPVIERVADRLKLPISIDTMKPAVARRALQAGASIVNDVAANRTDPQMWEIVAEFSAGYIANHMQGTPQTMQINPTYKDVVSEINEFFGDRLVKLKDCGVRKENVVLDPGIGFGKTTEHNLKILNRVVEFKKWNRPVMLGVSRKSFIGKVLGVNAEARLSGSLACAVWAKLNGVNIIRTHDVLETAQAIKMIEAIEASE